MPQKNTHILGGLLTTLIISALIGCAPQRAPFSPPPRTRPNVHNIRGIWVTRFDYKTKNDVIEIIDNCANAGFNTVFFQIRASAAAFYQSRIEPWDDLLGGRYPGFDPLAVACQRARKNNIALHAYVNVLPGWRGTKPPTNPEHLYNKKPQWFWYDQFGKRQPLQSFYVSLNPCLPEVQHYLTSVCYEIITRYDVAGLHLDYIRFPSEPPAIPPGSNLDYPRDKRTVSLFARETGKRPDSDPAAWNRWRTEQVTRLVRKIHAMVKKTKPRIALSAAVGADPNHHLNRYFQDSLGWMDEGILDFIVPMNYTADDQEFAQRNALFMKHPSVTRLVPGLTLERRGMSHQQVIFHARNQAAVAIQQTGGICVFAYSLLFDRPTENQSDEARRNRDALRRALLPVLQTQVRR